MWSALAASIVLICCLAVARSMYPSFDGSMNMQVARHLAEDGNYARTYGGLDLFPPEIQTNSVPILLGAAFIAVVGVRVIAVNLPNVIALVALSIVLSRLAGPGRLARFAGGVSVLGLPVLWTYGLGGYGEVWAAVLLLGAFVGVAWTTTDADRRPWLAGWFLLGTAFTVKTISLAGVAPLALALVVARVLGIRRERRTWALGAAAFLAPIALFESFRLVQLGSVGRWFDYWSVQFDRVRYQAGADDRRPQIGIVDSTVRRIGTLANSIDMPRPAALLFLLAPLAVATVVVVAAVRRRRRGDLDSVDRRVVVAIAGLAAAVGEFALWWFFVTPDEKAWFRRLYIAIVLLFALYLLLLRARSTWASPKLALVPGLLLGVAVPVVVTAGFENVRSMPFDRSYEAETRAAAAYLDSLPADVGVYGLDWWSAPQLGLVLDRDLDDLWARDTCSIAGTTAYVVWDRIAQGIVGPVPPDRSGAFVYTEHRRFGDAVALFSVTPAPGRCPPADT